MEEHLSLATFQPSHSLPPYLNSPRSLEACRLIGVQPVELVEIPFEEFQKDFGGDTDAAQRRFDRIDGSRRKALMKVKKKWKELCDINWVKDPPLEKGEIIVDVPRGAHCELFEIQADQFRKLEKNYTKTFQNMLRLELKSAADAVSHRQLLNKHEDISKQVDEKNREIQRVKEMIMVEQVNERRRKEEEDEARRQRLKKEFLEQAQKDREEELLNLAREKEAREQRELTRQQHAEYTHVKRDLIERKIDMVINFLCAVVISRVRSSILMRITIFRYLNSAE
jgi:hypothetical protein